MGGGRGGGSCTPVRASLHISNFWATWNVIAQSKIKALADSSKGRSFRWLQWQLAHCYSPRYRPIILGDLNPANWRFMSTWIDFILSSIVDKTSFLSFSSLLSKVFCRLSCPLLRLEKKLHHFIKSIIICGLFELHVLSAILDCFDNGLFTPGESLPRFSLETGV